MFAYISGKVLHADGSNITILVDNTGLWLEVFASPNAVLSAKNGENITLWLHHHITEVSQVLFGFLTLEEKNLFKNLIKVSGIGGKTALNMLGLGENVLLEAIQNEDDVLLSSVPGIGKKTAQKIIVDLKGSIHFPKISEKNSKNLVLPSEDVSLVASLVAMWYEKSLVEAVVANLDKSLSLSEKVKIAIKNLS